MTTPDYEMDQRPRLNEDQQYQLAMVTCPYWQYSAGHMERGTCRNGCWEEPECITMGPFADTDIPGWSPNELTAAAERRQRDEQTWRRV